MTWQGRVLQMPGEDDGPPEGYAFRYPNPSVGARAGRASPAGRNQENRRELMAEVVLRQFSACQGDATLQHFSQPPRIAPPHSRTPCCESRHTCPSSALENHGLVPR